MSAGVAVGQPGGSVSSGPGRLRPGARARSLGPPIAVFLIVLVLWEVTLTVLGVQQFLLPRPSVIAAALVDQWPTLQSGILFTATEALGGLLIGVTLGVGVALATSRWESARESLMPLAIAANSIPIIAFAPIANNWFSSQSPFSRMAIVALMVFFPMMINTVRGLTEVNPSAVELMHSLAATEGQVLRKLRIPNALPYIFTGLKIATTLSVIGAVVGEYFGGPQQALGIYITSEAYVFRYPNAWAAIVMACLLGIVFYLVVLAFERLMMPWHTAMREQEP